MIRLSDREPIFPSIRGPQDPRREGDRLDDPASVLIRLDLGLETPKRDRVGVERLVLEQERVGDDEGARAGRGPRPAP